VFINAPNGRGSLPALQAVGDRLNGKVVIDAANPLDFSQGFPPSLLSATPIPSPNSCSVNSRKLG
jgi:predicted dinucleotide-binding enzyme